MNIQTDKIRNIAIIAHVDHGKTTLVDKILNFCQSIEKKENTDRIMDSNDLEKERGITILSKNTAVQYQDYKFNIIDTPGHSDFGGEVERVLRMADACLLLVDAIEGPMPQTRFVLQKALSLNLKIILVVNKIDRPGCDTAKVVDDTLELFLELGADDSQLDFPVVYASAKSGYAVLNINDEKKDIEPLLETIISQAPSPELNIDKPFVFQVTTLDYNDYIGRICIGRIFSGKIKINDEVILVSVDEKNNEIKIKHRVTKLFSFMGLKRIEIPEAIAGDIVAIAGIPEMTIGDSLCQPENINTMKRILVEPPTVSMSFKVNDSPFSGKDGKLLTSRQIRERLFKEIRTNLSIKIEEQGESFRVMGRGELQLAILIENMRREGFELGVSKPEVILKETAEGKMEPYESVVMDIPEIYSGTIIQELNRRRGIMLHIEKISDNFVRVKYEIPTRGIIGFRNFYLTETRGQGSFHANFLEYRPYIGKMEGRVRGVLVSMENGATTTYALYALQERGDLFIPAGTPVYTGMIVGLHSKENDLDINPVKEKKLTNVRASGSDDALKLTTPRALTLEASMDLLNEDEILEVTPNHLRLRKKILNPSQRKKK
ncbi:MAG: translational GTPase TypA [Spirochaetia bacterium]|nr:translational GTPase TypA [Spirochaetia bacterium]